MSSFRENDGALEWSAGHQVVRIEPWGADSIRVRVGKDSILHDVPGALAGSPRGSLEVIADEEGYSVSSGRLGVRISAAGEVSFIRKADAQQLLAEQAAHFWWPGARLFLPNGNGYYRLEQRFKAYDGEKLFGLGQHQHGRLDQRGLVIELAQRNGEVSIPFMLSSRGYGLLWNSPAIGRVELAANGTRWVADNARQIDYWVTTGESPAEVLANYAEATGHAPRLPRWASGFWQSKLRYRTQDELMDVAREYEKQGLAPSVIVCDFFHWPNLGDWRFDSHEWPDPAKMVAELDGMGTRLMVSVWPSVSPLSDNYQTMADEGLVIESEHRLPVLGAWPDRGLEHPVGVAFYDATNPRARKFIWGQVKEHYYDLGVRAWWLDACEPEIEPGYPTSLRLAAGPGLEVANLYPREHARAFYEGMRSQGEEEILLLCRSAWAGSQKYGVAVWSGDIQSTFESLGDQVKAGLNMAVSGIPWWCSDIGGFYGGDPESPYFRELVVRWFEFGAFSPLFRLHGFRLPDGPLTDGMTGGPNEIWSFGEEAYEIMRDYIQIRERLRPYVHDQMEAATKVGLGLMRPLFVEFPEDGKCWDVDDAFMFGTDLLVAPVLTMGARERRVYLPEGVVWTNAWTDQSTAGGVMVSCSAPLERIPLFARAGAQLPIVTRPGGS
jgi:alpha-D-xyloside xylohydrolase